MRSILESEPNRLAGGLDMRTKEKKESRMISKFLAWTTTWTLRLFTEIVMKGKDLERDSKILP